MTYVLLIVVFLQGGMITTRSAATDGATLDDCKSVGAIFVDKLQGQKFKDEDGNELIVLDAQAICVPVTKQDHA